MILAAASGLASFLAHGCGGDFDASQGGLSLEIQPNPIPYSLISSGAGRVFWRAAWTFQFRSAELEFRIGSVRTTVLQQSGAVLDTINHDVPAAPGSNVVSPAHPLRLQGEFIAPGSNVPVPSEHRFRFDIGATDEAGRVVTLALVVPQAAQ